MDKLKVIISTLSADDVREFAAFAKRQKKSKNRKDLELFKLFLQKKKLKPQDIVEKLYPDTHNQVAYHALRKRLLKQLIDFVVLKRMEADTSTASSTMGLISMSRYLFDMGQDQIAWQFLQKAEKSAMASEHFDLLNTIYNIEIERADSSLEVDLSEVIKKWKENKELALADERANIANSVIKRELKIISRQGQDLDFDRIIQQVLAEYQLNEAVSKHPRLFYNLMSIARSAVVVKKDYHAFAPYLVEQYQQFVTQKGFASAHRYYKLSLLSMIAHVLYRSKQFDESIRFLQELREELEVSRGHYHQFYPKYVLLHAANLAFLGKSDASIQMLEVTLQDMKLSINEKDKLNIWVNLGLYYFQQQEMDKVVEVYRTLNHSDQYYEKVMGKEWAVKKSLCEMMFHYDFGNIDLAFNKLRAIERNYAKVFAQGKYANAKSFLKLIKSFFDQPILVSKPEFMEKVDSTLEFLPFEEEDLQAVSFYAWLKAKMLKSSYYEALLQLTRENM